MSSRASLIIVATIVAIHWGCSAPEGEPIEKNWVSACPPTSLEPTPPGVGESCASPFDLNGSIGENGDCWVWIGSLDNLDSDHATECTTEPLDGPDGVAHLTVPKNGPYNFAVELEQSTTALVKGIFVGACPTTGFDVLCSGATCDPGCIGTSSTHTFTAGDEVYILVDTAASARGRFALSVTPQ